MSGFLSTAPNLALSPFHNRTRPTNPLLYRTHHLGFPNQSPFLRGTLGVARFGFGQVQLPDPDGAEGLIKDLFGRAEGFLYTVADAAVSSNSDAVTGTKQSGDWLSGITYYMESVLKVCERIQLWLHWFRYHFLARLWRGLRTLGSLEFVYVNWSNNSFV